MNRKVLFLAVSLALSWASVAQDAPPRAARSGGSLPLAYTGDNARIGVGVDQDGEIHGEARGVFGFDGTHAFLAEGWLGHGGAGGVAFGYHWLVGERQPRASVLKLLLAADRNAFDDRKATFGFGIERRGGELGITYSHALSDERLIARDLDSSVETVTGNLDGRPFRQEITTDTLTELFEHPYEQSVGVRASRFFDRGLLRLRAGLDYERGDALLDGDEASQLAASVGIEKHFAGSGHSLALDVERARKHGPFDEGRDDTRATLVWRYEFGRPFRTAAVAVAPEASVAPAPPSRPTAIRNEVELSGVALFALERAELTAAAKADLQPLVQALTTRRVGVIEIFGHTCDLGTERYNQALSEARAAAVRDWLVAEGVPAEDMLVIGHGEWVPLVANDSEANRARNRRVELRFTTVEEIEQAPAPAAAVPAPAPAAAAPDDAWIDRALRNLTAHKRSVDTYRIRRVTETRNEGPIEFLNQAPNAVDDSASTQAGTGIAIAVLANDSDPDGDTLAVTDASTPANGTAGIQADGSILYTPNADFIGTDSFSYTVEDGNSGSATAMVTVTVESPPNLAPLAVDDVDTVVFGVTAKRIDVLVNDNDPDGDPLVIVDTGASNNATVDIIDGGAALSYQPNPGFEGVDTFTYTIEDGNGGSATATVSVTVEGPPVVNQPPLALDDAATTQAATEVIIPVLDNDSDPEGGALTILTTSTPANGVIFDIDGVIGYRPLPGFSGTDTFTYTVIDTGGLPATATVTVTVEASPNQPPVALADSVEALENTAIAIDVLANDSDPDGDTLTVTDVSAPTNGTVDIQADGSILYTPNAGFTGADTFDYTIQDGNGGSATAAVTVIVQSKPNQVPVAVDDTATTSFETPIDIDVLANDSDPDGDTLTVRGVLGLPGNGTVVDNGNGILTYTPDAGFSGEDSFVYLVEDGNGGSATATVTVTVEPSQNQAPIAVDDIDVMGEGVVSRLIDVLDNDSDDDGDTLTIVGVTLPGTGGVQIAASGAALIYSPNGFIGTESFTYTIEDGNGGSATATVTVTVTPAPNRFPVAVNDSAETLINASVDITVLDNDFDLDDDTLTIAAIGATAGGGTVEDNDGDGVLTYTPAPGFLGEDSFTYTISDGNGGFSTATVTVTVFQIP